MTKFSILVILVILTSVPVSVRLYADVEGNDEDFLPFYAELTEDFSPKDDSVELEKGERFIILRPLDDGELLVEFPRKGTYAISSSITNVPKYIEETKANAVTINFVPRMSYFLANRIISGESGWQYPLRSDTVNCFSRWIFLYGDSSEASTIEAVKLADSYYRELRDMDRAKTALIYMDITGNKAGIQSIADTLKPSIQSMPGYLSRGYSKSLAHLNDIKEFPVLVETQSSGRIVSKHMGLDQIRTFLE